MDCITNKLCKMNDNKCFECLTHSHSSFTREKPSKSKRLIILLIRHGIRYPKNIPEGWPLSNEVTKGEGALTSLGEL